MKTILFFISLFLNVQMFAQKSKTILFIGAHPDDETAISEVLIKYARTGNKVFVIIATNGKDGTRVTKIPAGDSLGNLRKKESACGCAKMGLRPPIFFEIQRLDTKIGTGNYFKEHQRFLDSLKIRIPSINPDVIITAGPDGDTHHSEHIVVSGAVTELLLAEGWVKKYPLYHFAWKKGTISVDPGSYMDEQYVNVKITFTVEDKNKAIDAMSCYVTQYTAQELKEEAERKLKDTENTINFRKFITAKGCKKEF
ncbi:MAG: PIG-L family deacetylase [Bacteroidetes bacterium]|nr:PIG-L family deacetylase [Bacteroidota bacterium]